VIIICGFGLDDKDQDILLSVAFDDGETRTTYEIADVVEMSDDDVNAENITFTYSVGLVTVVGSDHDIH
jgi:hypothetical protein